MGEHIRRFAARAAEVARQAADRAGAIGRKIIDQAVLFGRRIADWAVKIGRQAAERAAAFGRRMRQAIITRIWPHRRRLAIWFAASLVFQLGIYIYLDKVLFAPSVAYQVSATSENAVEGKAYYSRDRRYMAIVKAGTVEIHKMPGNQLIKTIDIGKFNVSYFRWLEDRDLALMGIYLEAGAGGKNAPGSVILKQVDPLSEGHEISTTIANLPEGSKITDVAYSTATNVIYMQVQTAVSPDLYRVYRTDANHELTRIPLRTNRIGRISLLYYEDSLLYDDAVKGEVIMRRGGDGSWRIISPYDARYRLIGVDHADNIYIARLNKEGMADKVLKGRLRVGFSDFKNLPAPVPMAEIRLSDFIGAAGR